MSRVEQIAARLRERHAAEYARKKKREAREEAIRIKRARRWRENAEKEARVIECARRKWAVTFPDARPPTPTQPRYVMGEYERQAVNAQTYGNWAPVYRAVRRFVRALRIVIGLPVKTRRGPTEPNLWCPWPGAGRIPLDIGCTWIRFNKD